MNKFQEFTDDRNFLRLLLGLGQNLPKRLQDPGVDGLRSTILSIRQSYQRFNYQQQQIPPKFELAGQRFAQAFDDAVFEQAFLIFICVALFLIQNSMKLALVYYLPEYSDR